MRLKKREIASREKIDSFIGNCSVVRIGMISRGEPYIVPVNFVYSDGVVYFHSSRKGRKADTFRNSPRVCLEFDEMRGVDEKAADTYYTSAVAWGPIAEIKDKDTAHRVLEMICSRYLETSRKITDDMVAATGIYSVKIEEVTGKENNS